MRATEFIIEGRGIAARPKGEKFVKSEGDEIELLDVVYFPPERGSYETTNDLDQDLQQWKDDNYQVKMFGNKNAGTKAAMLTIWQHTSGETFVFGRWLRKADLGLIGGTWSNTQFGKDTGYVSTDMRTTTQRLPIKPSDVLPTNNSVAPSGAIASIERYLQNVNVDESIKVQMISMIKNALLSDGGEFTPGAAEHARLHEVYTAEYAAPLAYIYGSNLLTGDMALFENEVLKVKGVGRTDFDRITWPSSGAEKLVDSYIYANNVKVGVSSKAAKGGGASASIDGVFQIITKNKQHMDAEFLNEYKDVLDTFEILMRRSGKGWVASVDGTTEAAIKYGIITREQVTEIKERMKSFKNESETLSPENQKLLKSSTTEYNPKLDHPNYNIGYHMMAVISRRLGNELKKLDIDTFFRKVLRYADMVQIYAKVQTDKNGGAKFSSFVLKYPPQFKGNIVIDAESNYYASGKPKGRIAFKLV